MSDKSDKGDKETTFSVPMNSAIVFLESMMIAHSSGFII